MASQSQSPLARIQKVLETCDDKTDESELLKRLDAEFGGGPIYGKNWWIPLLASSAILVLASISLVYLLSRPGVDSTKIAQAPHSTDLKVAILLYALWTLLVPLWFLTEHAFLFKGRILPTRREFFQYNQELAQKCWAAFVFIFGIVILIKFNIQVM